MEVYLTPKHDSKVTSRNEFVNVLERSWSSFVRRHDARYLWLQQAQSQPAETDTTLEIPKHKLFLNGVSLGTFVSPGDYRCHWKSPFCATRETLTDASQNTDSDSDDEDCSSNRLWALFEYDTESLSISWKQSENLSWRMEIALDSLADRVVVVCRQGRTFHLFLFLASQPKIYSGKPRPRVKFLQLVDAHGKVETAWERESCFESCDYRTFGSCNVLHLKLATLPQNLNSLIRRLEFMDFAVYYGDPLITDVEKSGGDLPFPRFLTFDASYSWFCLLTRGFKVTDQAQSDEFIQLLNASANNPQLDRVLDAVAARAEWLIFDLKNTFAEELENLQNGRTSEDAVMKPVGDQFVAVRRLLITPTTVRGLSAQWGVGNRVVRHYGSDRFIRVIIRDEDLSLLSAAVRLHKPISVITDFLRQDLVIADRRYHFLGCSNSQLREHGLWMYAGDGQEGHTVDGVRRWMGDLSRERCVATYVSRLGQFFSSSRNTIEVDHVELIPDVHNSSHSGYCFTDGIGKISSLLAKKVIKNKAVVCNNDKP